GTITLNRPKAFNTFNSGLKSALLQALGTMAEEAAVRAVVITGSGRAFCAGQDLKEHLAAVQAADDRVGESVTEFYNPMIESVTRLGKPVIAAVNGIAAGAGAGLAYACDLRIAARSATFRTSFAAVGLSADSGLSFTLPRLIGAGRAARLILLDEPMDADTALEWGAVDLVVDDATLAARTAEVAARLAAGPTAAYGWIKASLAQAASGDLAAALEFENRAQQACFRSADHSEALAAFVEKRPAVFTGR
ncbi:MAG: enoyl-CoA hydratase-related protein, partial [Actinomycetota bacterium]|nr:enoyl-CoA hydratase-related protein [Actinomycetota bacterium]